MGAEPIVAHRPQRHGQDDALQRDHACRPARRRARSASRARELVGQPSYKIAGAGDRLRAAGPPAVPVAVGRRAPAHDRPRGARAAGRSSGVYELFPRLAERKRQRRRRSSRAASSRCSRSARALLTNPQLLIMDEPSEGLAPTIIEHLIETFTRLVGEGIAHPAGRAEPRRRDRDGRAPARHGRRPDRRRDDGAGARRTTRSSQRRFLGRRARRTAWPTVVLLGTLDTKGAEYAFLRDRLREAGRRRRCSSTPGIHGSRGSRPTSRARRSRARRAPSTPRSRRTATAARRSTRWPAARRPCSRGSTPRAGVDGVAALGGSGNTSIAARAMRALPVGVPKLIVSTVAVGRHAALRRRRRLTMMYSVVDIAGLNRLSRAHPRERRRRRSPAWRRRRVPARDRRRPLVGATMFGVTTPCVTHARERLEELGYEVLVFHATGTGGQSMEALVAGGFLAGVLDVDHHRARRRARRRRALGRARPARGRRRARRSRRSSRSARSTWSTSARARPCPSASRTATSTSTTRRDADADDAGGDARELGRRIARKLSARPGRPRSSSRCGASPRSTSTGQPFHDAGGRRRRCSPRCARASTASRSSCSRSTPTSTTRRSRPRWPTACTS